MVILYSDKLEVILKILFGIKRKHKLHIMKAKPFFTSLKSFGFENTSDRHYFKIKNIMLSPCQSLKTKRYVNLIIKNLGLNQYITQA